MWLECALREGSTFEVKEDQDSPGIQVADVVLWLYSQLRKGKPLPDGCRSLIKYVLEVGWENDFSFKGVQREYMRQFGPMLAKPMTSLTMPLHRSAAPVAHESSSWQWCCSFGLL